MARLPQPGGDQGNWGEILNDYLSQSHATNGQLKTNSVGSSQIQDDAVQAKHIAPGAVTKSAIGLGNVDNTSDTDKPISTATHTSLNAKLNTTDLDEQVAAKINDATSATAGALTAKLSQPMTMAVLGDSLTEQGGELADYQGGPVLDSRPYAPWLWLNALLGWPFTLLGNFGIGGQTTSQILSRLDSVLALNPGWLHVLMGTNNMGVTGGLAQAKADWTTLLDRCARRSMIVVGSTIPPRLGSSWSGTQRDDTLALNQWLSQQARSRGGFVLYDGFAAVADGAGSNFRALVYGRNPTSDGVHLSSAGAYAVAKVGVAVLRPLIRASVPYANPTPGANLLVRPRPGLYAEGNAVPASWTAGGASAGSAVYSDVDRIDGFGTWKQVIVPVGGSMSLNTNVILGSSLVVGEAIQAVIEYDVSAIDATTGSNTRVALAVKAWNGTAYTTARYAMNDSLLAKDSHTAVLRTTPFTIPTGTTTVSLFLEITGGMTLKWDRAGLYKASVYPV